MRDRPSRRARGHGASLRICVTCRWKGLESLDDGEIRPGQRLHDLVRELAGPARDHSIHEIVCLSHCMNACNAVAVQRGKTPLLMTRMAPDRDTARALLDVLERFAASESGEAGSSEICTRPLVPPGVERARRRR